jgi:3-oxoacyl-[acyl-carrier protein] reductase
MDLGLKDRVAIVAAASIDLGRAVASELAREGAKLAICARTALTLEASATAIAAKTSAEVFWKAVDVTDSGAVRASAKSTSASQTPTALLQASSSIIPSINGSRP